MKFEQAGRRWQRWGSTSSPHLPLSGRPFRPCAPSSGTRSWPCSPDPAIRRHGSPDVQAPGADIRRGEVRAMSQRVVVTGMGTVNPIGFNVKESWDNAVHGVSGVGPITLFDSAELLVQIAFEVKGLDQAQPI